MPWGRGYQVSPEEIFPSVTTILSVESNQYLEEWRNKVGQEVADDISTRAKNRGTFLHTCSENYIKGLPVTFGMFQQDEKKMFQKMVPFLDQIDDIHCLETTLFSRKLKVAGTVDCIARYKDQLRILDWKTSRSFKTADDIHGYFIQCSMYALAFWEQTDIAIEDIGILMMTEEHGVLEFLEKTKIWLPRATEFREKFRKVHGV